MYKDNTCVQDGVTRRHLRCGTFFLKGVLPGVDFYYGLDKSVGKTVLWFRFVADIEK